MAAILDLFEPEIDYSILHPGKPYHRIKHEVNQTIHSRDHHLKTPRWCKFEGHVMPNEDKYQKHVRTIVFGLSQFTISFYCMQTGDRDGLKSASVTLNLDWLIWHTIV